MNGKDLVVLAADKNMEHALMGLFSRPQALGIRRIEVDVFVHPQRDPGCAVRGVEFLTNLSERYSHGLLMFDHEGSGRESTPPKELQDELDGTLSNTRWGNRARTIVLTPELEAWVWSGSPHVADVAGWSGRRPTLREWLTEQGYLSEDTFKPNRPKEAFEAALREARKPRSSSLYQQMAERVSLRRCADESFQVFRNTMTSWFQA